MAKRTRVKSRKKPLFKRKPIFISLPIIAFVIAVVIVFFFVKSSDNLNKATTSINTELSNINFIGKPITVETVNNGCSSSADEFGNTSWACSATGIKAFLATSDYQSNMVSADHLIQSLGWQPEANSNLTYDLNKVLFVPISTGYYKVGGGTLALFSLRKAQLPDSGILDVTDLGKKLGNYNQYIYGVQIGESYPTWPSRFFSINSITNSDQNSVINQSLTFTPYLPTYLPAGYKKMGDLQVYNDNNPYVVQSYINNLGHGLYITETQDSGDPNWLISCGSEDGPSSSCQFIGETTTNEKVYRATYRGQNNRQWVIVHKGTDINLSLGIDLTDAQVVQMFDSLK